MEKQLPTELEVLALKTLMSHIVSVLNEEQKTILRKAVQARPMEVPDINTTPQHMDYITRMQEFMRDSVDFGIELDH